MNSELLSTLPPPTGNSRDYFPTLWDSTMRGTFASCPNKFHYEYLQCLSPHEQTSIHLVFGGAFASGVEAFRKAYYKEEGNHTPENLKSAYAAGFTTIVEKWGDYPVEGVGNKSLYTCLDCLVSYFSHFKPSFDHIQPYRFASGEPAVECSFAIPLELNNPITGEQLIYAGRYDMIGEYNGQLFAVDEKTTSSMGSSFLSSWDMRAQLTGYCFAAQQYGLPVAGAIIRASCVKLRDTDHAEIITNRSPFMIEQWLEQLHRDLERAILMWKENRWDKNFDSACVAYSSRCAFTTPCSLPNPERWIPESYSYRFWNPTQEFPNLPNPAQVSAFGLQDWLEENNVEVR